MTAFNKTIWLATLVIAGVLIGSTPGCNRDPHPRRYPVAGKITFPDGEPVRTGVVEFMPVGGELTAHGTIASDGTYALTTITHQDGAVPGKYKVVVKQFIFYDRVPKSQHDHGGDVSLEFADERSTPLEFDVQQQSNVADFEVTYHKP